MSEIILKTKNLVKHFPIYGGIFKRKIAAVRALDGISFAIKKGEIFGLVGESGCGKTTTGRTLLRLVEPTSGEIYFEGKNILKLQKEEMRKLRHRMQIIFQDPFSSLDPRMTVFEIISEPLSVHGYEKVVIKEKVFELIENVGLEFHHSWRYPHEFSGGQRQRIAIARALSLNPSFIVADEPVSGLDVSIRALIIDLMKRLQKELELTYLFISHDLSVVKYVADRIAVMYLGKIVELASDKELFNNTQHPYTKALIAAVPIPDPKVKRERIILKGDVPSPINPPSGCRFHPRCPVASPECSSKNPELVSIDHEHLVACNLI